MVLASLRPIAKRQLKRLKHHFAFSTLGPYIFRFGRVTGGRDHNLTASCVRGAGYCQCTGCWAVLTWRFGVVMAFDPQDRGVFVGSMGPRRMLMEVEAGWALACLLLP